MRGPTYKVGAGPGAGPHLECLPGRARLAAGGGAFPAADGTPSVVAVTFSDLKKDGWHRRYNWFVLPATDSTVPLGVEKEMESV
jgi:hypothetical protein